jgi:hypothetical protein
MNTIAHTDTDNVPAAPVTEGPAMSRLQLAIAHRCPVCATVRVLRGPQLTEAPVCPVCGGPVTEGRRATDADWQVRLVLRRLAQIRDRSLSAPAGKFVGLTDRDRYFLEQVRNAACADRWFRTVVHSAATALVNADLNQHRREIARTPPAHARHHRNMIVALDAFHFACKKAGV